MPVTAMDDGRIIACCPECWSFYPADSEKAARRANRNHNAPRHDGSVPTIVIRETPEGAAFVVERAIKAGTFDNDAEAVSSMVEFDTLFNFSDREWEEAQRIYEEGL